MDTNLLVYAHRADADWHEPARRTLKSLAEGASTWSIPWPCVHEFLAIVTHPKVFDPPSTLAQAADQMGAWLASPSLALLGEGVDHWTRLRDLATEAKIRGPVIHDARIAAICLESGVSEFLTADRDFSRFPRLQTRNPLLEKH